MPNSEFTGQQISDLASAGASAIRMDSEIQISKAKTLGELVEILASLVTDDVDREVRLIAEEGLVGKVAVAQSNAYTDLRADISFKIQQFASAAIKLEENAVRTEQNNEEAATKGFGAV